MRVSLVEGLAGRSSAGGQVGRSGKVRLAGMSAGYALSGGEVRPGSSAAKND